MKNINALGFIEMYGLISCVEAADAMVKSANVRLIQYCEVSAGLVSIIVEGDVASCRAAVDAGIAAGGRLGTIVTNMVIPRPTDDTVDMILNMIPSARADYKKGFNSGGNGGSGDDDGSQPGISPSPAASKEHSSTVVAEKSTKVNATSEKKSEVKEDKASQVKEKSIAKPKEQVVIEKNTNTQKKQTEQKKVAPVVQEKKSVEKPEVKKTEPVKTEQKKIPTKKVEEVSVNNKKTLEEKTKPVTKPKSGVASVLAQFVQATEGVPFTEQELDKVVDYILAHKKGYTWKEISRHFPQHSKVLSKKLDEAVVSGKLAKIGSHYCRP